jgi:hypothetical protein
VFKSDSEENEELSFADAYKNDILQNREPKREDNSYKIVIIMVLMAILGGVATFGYVSISNSNQDEIEDIEPPEESGLLNNIDDITEDGVGNIDELNGSISSEENYIEDLAKLSNEHSKL